MTPRVTIGMPVRNGEPYLGEALDAILGQTLRDIEVVVADNASTDGTPALVRERARRDPRLRFIRSEENLGAAANYNRVLHLARAPFFKWAAADDLVAPTFLERTLEALARTPDAVLAYPRTTIIDRSGKPLCRYEGDLVLPEPLPRERFRRALERLSECNAVFGVIRTGALRLTAGIGPYQSSDVVLLAELSLHGRFVRVDEPLFFRREHERSSSADHSPLAQQRFFDPRRLGRPLRPTWRQHLEYGRAIRRAPLPAGEKLRCFALLGRAALARRERLWRELRAPGAPVQGGPGPR